MILQDRPEALNDVIDGLENVELMEYSFFTPQPIKGTYRVPTFMYLLHSRFKILPRIGYPSLPIYVYVDQP